MKGIGAVIGADSPNVVADLRHAAQEILPRRVCVGARNSLPTAASIDLDERRIVSGHRIENLANGNGRVRAENRNSLEAIVGCPLGSARSLVPTIRLR